MENVPIDLVVIAGDLAYSGAASEYERLRDQVILPLQALEMTKESKFIAVPGNHDLNCSDTLPINWEGLGKTRQELFWNTDERGTNIRKNRSVGFREYAQFLKQCNIFGPDGVVEVGTVVTINTETPATIICLNTALFTDKELS